MASLTKSNNFEKNARLKIRLKAFKNGEVVVDTTRRKVRPLQHFIRSLKGVDGYYLKVTYGIGRTVFGIEELYNDGDYTNKKDLLQALSIFTSREEVGDYIESFAVSDEKR